MPPAPPPSHRLVTGDEMGLIKVVDVPAPDSWEQAQVVSKWGEPDRSRAIQSLCISCEPSTSTSGRHHDDVLLGVARAGGKIEVLRAASGTMVATLSPAAAGKAHDNACKTTGLTFLSTSERAPGSGRPPKLLSCTMSGVVRLHGCGAADATAAAEGGGDGDAPSTSYGDWEQELSFQTAPSVNCAVVDPGCRQVALGGEGVQLQVWDLATQQRTLLGKGGKPNRSGLMDLAHVTAVAWLPEPGAGAGGGGGGAAQHHRVLVGTLQHKVWLYDTRAGRRPQQELDWGEARVSAIAPEADGQRAWVANGQGCVEVFDLRAGKMQGALKGAGGSVRSLCMHPSQPLLASAGLDRFLRVHCASGRKLLCNTYLKQQMTGVVWAPVPQPAAGAHARQQEEEEGSSDDDGMGGRAETNRQKRDTQRAAGAGSDSHHRKKRADGDRDAGGGSSKKRKSKTKQANMSVNIE